MTGDEFGEVDIDLLADYIGGALDGPGEAEVSALIVDHPRWRETYDLLLPRDGGGRGRAERAAPPGADAGRSGHPGWERRSPRRSPPRRPSTRSLAEPAESRHRAFAGAAPVVRTRDGC